jgi:hypothetical protein
VECHGTGTATGDPLELAAVAGVLGGGEDITYIGSVCLCFFLSSTLLDYLCASFFLLPYLTTSLPPHTETHEID